MNITLEIDDHVLDVDYDYQPYVPETLESPTIRESIAVDGVFVNGGDVFKSLPESTKNKISDCIWEIVNDD